MKRLWYYYIYLLLIWGSFRYFVRLPEVVEELWFKPVLWIVPLFWWNLSMKEKIVMFGKKWGESLILGLVVGLVYFGVLRWGRPMSGGISADILGMALATAVTEEMVFSGFVAAYLEKMRKGRWTNYLLVALMTAMMRLPILLFVYRAGVKEIAGVVLVVAASAVINAWIRVKSGNVSGSILARTVMNFTALG